MRLAVSSTVAALSNGEKEERCTEGYTDGGRSRTERCTGKHCAEKIDRYSEKGRRTEREEIREIGVENRKPAITCLDREVKVAVKKLMNRKASSLYIHRAVSG